MKAHPLKAERERRGWSQAMIAEALGTSQRVVICWEEGRLIPYPFYREQLAKLFGMSAEELGLLLPSGTQKQEEAEKMPVLATLEAPPLVDPTIPEILDRAGSLVGRANLLMQIKERLLQGDGPTLTALNGLPGSGKTSLVVALTADQEIKERFEDGILWAALGPHPDVLGQLVRWGKLLGVEPTDVEDALSRESWGQALRAAMSYRRMLLIIDDAWRTEDALAMRIGGPGCAHLLTTRLPQVAFAFSPDGTLAVSELGKSDGLALLARYVPDLVQQDPKGAQALVRTVGGLPLALTLMGKYLASQAFTGQPRRLQAALNRLRDTEQRLRLSMPIPLNRRSPSLPDNVPLSLIAAISISDQHLSAQARATLYALAVFPPKPNNFSEEAALAISQQQVETLDALWDAGLLETCGTERYALHQTIADYAHTKSPDLAAQQRLVEYILTYVQKHENDYKELENEIDNIIAGLDAAVHLRMFPEIVQAIISLVNFLRIRGFYNQADHYLRVALEATIAVDDRIGQMIILCHLADFADLREVYGEAEAYGQQGLALAQELGQIDVESDLLGILGLVAFRRGYHAQAANFYEEALQLARQLGDHERTSNLLCNFGKMVSRDEGNYRRAEALFQEGLLLARQSGYQEQIARLLAYLGGVAIRQGNYAQAERYCLEGLSLARELGYRENLGFLLSHLGSIAWERGNFAQAEAYYQEALALARQIGHRKQICNVLAYLGGALTFPFQDKYAQAKIYLQEGIELARQIEDQSGLVFLLAGYAATIGIQGDYAQANVYFQESVELGKQRGLTWEVFAAYIISGFLHLKYQKLDAAATAFRQVLTLRKNARWDPQEVAAALYGLAQVAALQGKMEEARRLGQESLASFEVLGHYWAEKVKNWLQSLPLS